MPLVLGALSEPLASCVRAIDPTQHASFFRVGDNVVIQVSGHIGVLTGTEQSSCLRERRAPIPASRLLRGRLASQLYRLRASRLLALGP
jgi:hypothetical protein